MLDEDTYVTNDMNDPWLTYHGNTTIQVWFPPEVAKRCVVAVTVYAGTDETPNSAQSQEEGANYTMIDGQLATFTLLNTNLTYVEAGAESGFYGGSVMITNSSCASYFARVVVQFGHCEAGASGSAGGGPTGAGIDAGAGAVVDSGVGPLAEASADAAGSD